MAWVPQSVLTVAPGVDTLRAMETALLSSSHSYAAKPRPCGSPAAGATRPLIEPARRSNLSRFLLRTLRPALAALLLFAVACGDSEAPVASVDEPVSLLFVQSSGGATLSGSTLTLTGVSPQTIWFTDRPYRDSGEMTTADFVSKWGSGADSFADDPPNAGFSCEVGGEPANYVVELTNPSLDGDNLSYSVESVGDDPLPSTLECDADADLFIDSEEPSSTTFTLIFLNNTGDDLSLDVPLAESNGATVGSYPSFPLSNAKGRRVTVTNLGGSNAAISFAAIWDGTTYRYSPESAGEDFTDACINTPPQIADGDILRVSILNNIFGYRVQITNETTGAAFCRASLQSSWDSIDSWLSNPVNQGIVLAGVGTVAAIGLGLIPELVADAWGGEVGTQLGVGEDTASYMDSETSFVYGDEHLPLD